MAAERKKKKMMMMSDNTSTANGCLFHQPPASTAVLLLPKASSLPSSPSSLRLFPRFTTAALATKTAMIEPPQPQPQQQQPQQQQRPGIDNTAMATTTRRVLEFSHPGSIRAIRGGRNQGRNAATTTTNKRINTRCRSSKDSQTNRLPRKAVHPSTTTTTNSTKNNNKTTPTKKQNTSKH
jgi:hypothetical protein